MSAAEILQYKGSPSRLPLSLVREEKIIAIDADGTSLDQPVAETGKVSGRSSNRRFKAEAPVVLVKQTSSQTQMAELLADAQEFFRARGEGDTVESSLVQMKKLFPSLMGVFANRAGSVKNEAPETKGSSSNKLFDYLTDLMLFQVATSKDQSTLVQMNEALSDGGIAMVKAAGDRATAALNKYEAQVEAEKEAAQKQSIWSTIIAVVMVVAGALSGDFVATGMGVIQLLMQTPLDKNGTTLNSMLENSLSDSPALQMIVPLLIAVVETAALCGLQALAEKAMSSVATSADVAASSATTVAKDIGSAAAKAGASAAEDVGAAVVKDAVDAQQNVVAQGLKTTMKEAAKTASKSSARRILDTLQALKVPQFMMLLSVGQFWPAVAKQIAEGCTSDPTEQQTISEWISASIMLTTMLGGMAIGSAGGNMTNWVEKLQGLLGEDGYQAIKESLRLVQFVAAAECGAWGIAKSGIEKDQVTTLNDQASARCMVAVATGFNDRLQASLAGTQDSFKKVYQDFALINENTDRFLDPYDPRNYQG